MESEEEILVEEKKECTIDPSFYHLGGYPLPMDNIKKICTIFQNNHNDQMFVACKYLKQLYPGYGLKDIVDIVKKIRVDYITVNTEENTFIYG
jgi:hypothetical protein